MAHDPHHARNATGDIAPKLAELTDDVLFADAARAAKNATREVVGLRRHTALDRCRQAETAVVRAAMADGAPAATVALDAAHCTLVRFRLWPDLRADRGGGDCQCHRIGHVPLPRPPH